MLDQDLFVSPISNQMELFGYEWANVVNNKWVSSTFLSLLFKSVAPVRDARIYVLVAAGLLGH